ncbi:MAG: STAS/SEC14 domain-containing protein [Deltaproteobacteria bacterium]|nr:STAS/SEC14 domain-containing protein [Deltaproteobacteria bacterium]
MGAEINQDRNGIWVLHVSGALRKEELDAVQAAAVQEAGPEVDAKVLITLADDFSGWVGTEVWNDMSFFVEYGDRIARIAIVGDPKWETGMLAFAGDGLRRAPVRYFAKLKFPDAYDWLLERSA